MTQAELNQIQVRRIEARRKLNSEVERLNAETDLETRSKIQPDLDTARRELDVLDSQYAAALKLVETEEETTETRERNTLIEQSDLGRILHAVYEQRQVDGREAELQQEYGLPGNACLIDCLETRDVTPAPAETGQQQRGIIPAVFPDAVGSHLGVGMPSVGIGKQNYVVVTSKADVGTPAKNAPQGDTTGSFGSFVLTPKRAQAEYFHNIEDAAVLSGMGSALRGNLRMALRAKFDDLLLNDATDGLLGGGLTQPSNPAAVATWAGYKKAVTDQVDGLYASMPDSVRLVIGGETYSHASGIYRGTTTENEDGYEVMQRLSGGVRISSHIPAAASDIQGAIAARATGLTHAVMPIWRQVSFIIDNVTKSDRGQIRIVAVALWALKVVRAAGFSPLKFKLA